MSRRTFGHREIEGTSCNKEDDTMTNLQQVQSALGTDVITKIGMLVHDVERSAQAWARCV